MQFIFRILFSAPKFFKNVFKLYFISQNCSKSSFSKPHNSPPSCVWSLKYNMSSFLLLLWGWKRLLGGVWLLPLPLELWGIKWWSWYGRHLRSWIFLESRDDVPKNHLSHGSMTTMRCLFSWWVTQDGETGRVSYTQRNLSGKRFALCCTKL